MGGWSGQVWCVGWGRGAGEPLQSARLGICGLGLLSALPESHCLILGKSPPHIRQKGLILKFR